MVGRALVVKPGAMRNIWTSGFFHGSNLNLLHFDSIFTCSSGAPTCAYAVTGQGGLGVDIYAKHLTEGTFFRKRNLFHPRRSIMDLDYLVRVFRDLIPLHTNRIDEHPTTLIVGITHWQTCENRYVEMRSHNALELIKVTCAFPFVSRPVFYQEDWWLDGGLGDPLPVIAAYEAGFRKIAVISNEPEWGPNLKYGKLAAFLSYPRSRAARKAIQENDRRYAEAWEFILHPPSDCEIRWVAPDQILPCSLFEQRRARLEDIWRRGVEMGVKRGGELYFI